MRYALTRRGEEGLRSPSYPEISRAEKVKSYEKAFKPIDKTFRFVFVCSLCGADAHVLWREARTVFGGGGQINICLRHKPQIP